jgi:hypothetical protein
VTAMAKLSLYESRYLIEHLQATGRSDDVHRLLSLSRVDGMNYWFAEKEARGDQEGYANDLKSGFTIAKQTLSAAGGSQNQDAVALIMRYCVCLATLNGFAESLSAGVLKELARRKIWNSKAVLDYARRTPDPSRRITSLCSVFAFLDSADQDECYRHASEAAYDLEVIAGTPSTLVMLQQEALSKLAGAFAEGGRYDFVIRCCTECQSWQAKHQLIGNAARLLATVPTTSLADARSCAQSLYASTNDLVERSYLLSLLPEIEQSACLEAVSEAVSNGSLDVYQSIEALKSVRSYLSIHEFHRRVHDIYVRVIRAGIEDLRVKRLVRLLALLDSNEQNDVLQEILPTIRRAEWADVELKTLLMQLCEIYALDGTAIVKAVNEIQSDYMRSVLATVIIRIQPETERENSVSRVLAVIAALRARGDTWSAEELLYALSQVSCYLTTSRANQLFQLAKTMTDQKLRLRTLAELLPHISELDLESVILTEIGLLKHIDNYDVIENFCAAAAFVSSSESVGSMPQLLRAPRTDGWFLVGLEQVLCHLEDSANRAETIAWIITALHNAAEPIRYWCLLSIVPYLTIVEQSDAFELGKGLANRSSRLHCCCEIVKFTRSTDLSEEMQKLINSELGALTEARERADALIMLLNAGPPLPTDLLIEDAFQSISRVEHSTHRAELLSQIGVWGDQGAERMKSELVDTIFRGGRPVVGRDVLKILAPTLAGHVLQATLQHLRLKSDDDLRVEALPEILARVAALGGQDYAFRLIAERPSQRLKEECLVALAPHLDKRLLLGSLSTYLEIENDYHRDRALSALCARAAQIGVTADLACIASSIRDPAERVKALCALVSAGSNTQEAALMDGAILSFGNVNERMRGNVIKSLVEALVVLRDREHLRESFLRVTDILVNESREELVPHAYSMAPVLVALAGAGAVGSTISAVRDVVRWWP